ncbi:MAG: DUF1834 family protein [Desulfocapsaceae bacterium]|nr:DUF1834 family protein [Desulfocapsaceae bacterium]
MLTQIEDAIVALLTTKLAASSARISVQKGFEGLPQPAVYVSTEAGRFEKISQSTFREHLTLFVDVLFSQRSDERERRKGIYLILEGILQTLLLQDLGLQVKPIEPQNWRNTTTEEFRKQGLLAFSLELTTSYTISKQDDETVTDLLAVGLNYYLEPGDRLEASDTVTLAG